MGNVIGKKKSNVATDDGPVCQAALDINIRQLHLKVLASMTPHSESGDSGIAGQLQSLLSHGTMWMRKVDVQNQWDNVGSVLDCALLCVTKNDYGPICCEILNVADSFYWIALGSSSGNVETNVARSLTSKIAKGRQCSLKHIRNESWTNFRRTLEQIEESLDATSPMDGLTGTGFMDKLSASKELRKMGSDVSEGKNKKKWMKLMMKYHPDKQVDETKRRDSTKIFQFLQSAKQSAEKKNNSANDTESVRSKGLSDYSSTRSNATSNRSVGGSAGSKTSDRRPRRPPCCLGGVEEKQQEAAAAIKTGGASNSSGSIPLPPSDASTVSAGTSPRMLALPAPRTSSKSPPSEKSTADGSNSDKSSTSSQADQVTPRKLSKTGKASGSPPQKVTPRKTGKSNDPVSRSGSVRSKPLGSSTRL